MADPYEVYANTLVPMVVETTNRGERTEGFDTADLKEAKALLDELH